MPRDLLDEAQRLRQARHPFALATVVAAQQPASGTPGARAIVLPDGQVQGWIGGHCAQPTVIRQALAALAEGTARLVVITPNAPLEEDHPSGGAAGTAGQTGLVRVAMTCAGQGELHIFIEPFLPRAELVVVGTSPVAQALARLGVLLEFEVWACDDTASMETFAEADRLIPSLDALAPQLSPRSYVVVATIGAYDEAAVQVALESPASYVGLVASQRRFAAVRDYLRDRGLSDERVARLKRPKGTAGQAVLPAEIAFSVMAELVEVRRQRVGLAVTEGDTRKAPPAPRATATDPICGMAVDIATAHYTAQRDGQTVYFCCAACQTKFEGASD